MALEVKSDVKYIIKRKSTPEEEKLLGKSRVITALSLDDVKTLDSDQNYEFIAGIPKEVSLKEEPVKNFKELAQDTEIKDELSTALFNEMKHLLSETYNLKYTTRENKERSGSLLLSIQKLLFNHLYEYASIRSEEDVLYLDTNDMYWIIFGIADIINREKLGDALIKLQQEGGIPWSERQKVEGKAQSLAYRNLSKYSPSKPGWDWPEFKSFKEFHESITDLIHNSIEKYEEKEQPTLILEMAYEILESKRKEKHRPKKFYPPKEMPWYAKN